MFRRGPIFYLEDRETGQQTSLRTKDESEARKLVQARNDSVNQPMLNMVMAKTFLSARDPKLVTRTWGDVMTLFCQRGKAPTRMRHERVVRTKPMQFLRSKTLIETTADDFFHAISIGTNSTVIFLQTLQNDALGMGWLPAPVLPKKRWPKMPKKPRRAITLAEHQLMVESVSDKEWVTIPKRGSISTAREFVGKNIEWLERQIQKLEAQPKTVNEWKLGTEIYFWGEQVKILVETANQIRFGPELLSLRDLTVDLRPAIQKHLRKLAERVII